MTNMFQLKDAPPDLIGELIKNTSENEEGRALLYGESRLIISAGSETTSTALTFVFMQLATHPHYTHAIRAEQRATISTYHCSRPLPLLDAVINESMRLWPSVFFASQRVTPPEGLTVNGQFIPGNMIVQVPRSCSIAMLVISSNLNRSCQNGGRPDRRWY